MVDKGHEVDELVSTHGFVLVHSGTDRTLYRDGHQHPTKFLVRNFDMWVAQRGITVSGGNGNSLWQSPIFKDPLTALAYAELNDWSSSR